MRCNAGNMTVITAPALATAHEAVAEGTSAPSSPARASPPRPEPHRVHHIRGDAEALQVARQLAAEFAPGAAERDHERRLPWDELQRWSESGLGGMTVPRRFGGAQVSCLTLAEVFVTLCAADPALGQVPQNHFALLGVLREAGSEAQQQRFYAEALAGLRLGNAGPERKSAEAPTLLRGGPKLATREDGGLTLNGQRFYSTGALFAHRIPTRALDAKGRPVQAWVPADAPGVQVIDDWDAFGQRTTASGSVRFDQVQVDPEDVLPLWRLAERPGLYGPVSQLIQAAIDQGIAQAALADALLYVREHARPWVDSGLARASDDPHLIAEVGRLQITLHAAHELLREAAGTLDELAASALDAEGRWTPLSPEASAHASVTVAQAKVMTTRAALAASEQLFELAGSSATRLSRHLDRHWRNARVHTLHDPVRWKLQLIGNHHLNGVLPARHSWN